VILVGKSDKEPMYETSARQLTYSLNYLICLRSIEITLESWLRRGRREECHSPTNYVKNQEKDPRKKSSQNGEGLACLAAPSPVYFF